MPRELEKPFFVRNRGGLRALPAWLKGRSYNCFGHTRDDRNGNPMIALAYDWNPDKDYPLPDQKGLVIVIDHSLQAETEKILGQHVSK